MGVPRVKVTFTGTTEPHPHPSPSPSPYLYPPPPPPPPLPLLYPLALNPIPNPTPNQVTFTLHKENLLKVSATYEQGHRTRNLILKDRTSVRGLHVNVG